MRFIDLLERVIIMRKMEFFKVLSKKLENNDALSKNELENMGLIFTITNFSKEFLNYEKECNSFLIFKLKVKEDYKFYKIPAICIKDKYSFPIDYTECLFKEININNILNKIEEPKNRVSQNFIIDGYKLSQI